MAGWHHWFDGRESEWTPGVGNGQGGMACCDSWGCKESDTTEWLNRTELILSSIEAISIYFPTNSARAFHFCTPSPAFIVCRLFDDDHSDRCEMISDCSFHLHFSNNDWCWVSSHLFVSRLYVFFGEMFVRYFSHFLIGLFVFMVLSCMSCCIFWKLILYELFHLLLFSFLLLLIFPFLGLSFLFAYSFLCWVKAFKFN